MNNSFTVLFHVLGLSNYEVFIIRCVCVCVFACVDHKANSYPIYDVVLQQ